MSLRSKVILALRWSAGLRLLSQLIAWAMTLVVVRLLSPSDYGLMSMATVVIAFLMMFNELGIGPALVQRESLNNLVLRQAFGIALASNALVFAVVWILTPSVAQFFGEAELVPIIRTLSIQFMFIPFSTIPEAFLLRNLDFRRKSIIDLVSNVLGGVTSLALALSGFGVWSLVFGSLTLMSTRSIGSIVAAPHFVLPRFSLTGTKQLLSFGSLITADRFLWFFYSRADVVVVGRILGTEALGIYSVAMQIASLPLHKVNGILNEIAFPAFSRIQGDMALVRSYLGKAARVISFVAFPVFLGISSISPVFVEVVLGEQWKSTALPLATLACIMPLRMISSVIASTLQGVGRVGVSVGNLVYAAVIIPIALLIGTNWGITGVCVAWLVGFPAVTTIEMLRSRRFVALSILDFTRIFWRPLLGSLIMWGGVYMITAIDTTFSYSVPGLTFIIFAGAATYLIFTLLFNRDNFRETMALTRI